MDGKQIMAAIDTNSIKSRLSDDVRELAEFYRNNRDWKRQGQLIEFAASFDDFADRLEIIETKEEAR